MKEENFIEFLKKNKIVIICLIIALILLISGVFKVLFNIALTVLVLLGAIYIGFKIQGDEDYLKNFFRPKKKN